MNINALKPAGIPFIVTLYASFVGVLGTYLGVYVLINPPSALGYVADAELMSGSWAGRNLGIGLITLIALYSRSAFAYMIAFVGCFSRELGDVIGALRVWDSFNIPIFTGFFIADILCLSISARAVFRGHR